MTKAIILAAGRGSRLHPYTEKTPKCLTELAGRTLISRQLEAFKRAGVDEIYIVAGYQEDQLQLPDTRKIINPDWQSTNMVESLFCASEFFGRDIIVCYSDIIFEQNVVEKLLASTHDVSVIIDKKWRDLWEFRFEYPLDDAESLRTDEEGRIIDIGNPVDDIDLIMAQYIGLMRFRNGGIDSLVGARKNLDINDRAWKQHRPVQQAYMTDLLMEMILANVPVQGIPINGGWLEVDTVDDFHKYQKLVEQNQLNRFLDFQS